MDRIYDCDDDLEATTNEVKIDYAAKDDLERDKLAVEEKIEGAKLGVKIAETNTQEELESKKIASKDKLEGAKIGVEIAKELMVDKRDRDIEEMIDKRDTKREDMIDNREIIGNCDEKRAMEKEREIINKCDIYIYLSLIHI